jgi:hypothetical protein
MKFEFTIAKFKEFCEVLSKYDADCVEIVEESDKNTQEAVSRLEEEDNKTLDEQRKEVEFDSVARKQKARGRLSEQMAELETKDQARRNALYDQLFQRESPLRTGAKSAANDPKAIREAIFDGASVRQKERDALWRKYLDGNEVLLEEWTQRQARHHGQEYRGQFRKDREDRQKRLVEELATIQRDERNKLDEKTTRFKERFDPEDILQEYMAICQDEPFPSNYKCRKQPPAYVPIATLSSDPSLMELCTHTKTMLERHYPSIYRHGELRWPLCVSFDQDFNFLFDMGGAPSGGGAAIAGSSEAAKTDLLPISGTKKARLPYSALRSVGMRKPYNG